MRAVIASLFFVLTAWFLLDPVPADPPVHATPSVDAAELGYAPPRTPLSDPPMVEIGGVAQRCSDCHALFPSRVETPDELRQHGHLVHDHGMNDRCFNCHSIEDRDKLVLHDGSLVAYDDVQQLCAKCHGTVYRDWQRGMHGRTNGSWLRDDPRHARLVCTQCHDPHAPAYDPIVPLPGPSTFRMGEAPEHALEHAEPNRNPLRRGAGASEETHR